MANELIKTSANQNEIILYQPDAKTEVEVRVENETLWLTQPQIAMLFGTKRPAITKHLNNIFKSGELDELSTCSILEHMGNDSKQTYWTKFYNLDAILSVGYRVNSRNATLFRQWANRVLKDYLLRGHAINQCFERVEHRVTASRRDASLGRKRGIKRLSHPVGMRLSVKNLCIKTSSRMRFQSPRDASLRDADFSTRRFLPIESSLRDDGCLGKKLFAFSKMEAKPAVILKGLNP